MINDGLPENCQSTTKIDTAHLKLCCHNSSNSSDGPVVNRSSSASSSSSTSFSCDNRSDYISSDLSEGLSLSDAEEKISTDKSHKSEICNSSSPSQMYHHVPIEAYDDIIDKDIITRRKLGNAQDDSFSNGIIPIKEVEHLDIIGTPKTFKRNTLSPARDGEAFPAGNFEDPPLQSSSTKQVNKRYYLNGHYYRNLNNIILIPNS